MIRNFNLSYRTTGYAIATVGSLLVAVILAAHSGTVFRICFISLFETLFLCAVGVHFFRLQTDIAHSLYVERFLGNRNLFIIALLAAVFCLLISYPGNLYSDSYGRIGLARNLKHIIAHSIRGDAETVYSWNTVTPCYFMALFYWLTGNFAGYTFFQAFSFFFVALLLIKKIVQTHRLLAYLLFILNPLFFCVSIYYETGIGVVIGIGSLVLLLNIDISDVSPVDKAVAVILVTLSAFVAFGYRANTFTILPALLLIVMAKQKKRHAKICVAVSLSMGLIFVMLFPRLLHINTMSSGSLSFIWEMGTNIARMPQGKQEKYNDYLDDLFGDGATLRLCGSVVNAETRELRPNASFLWEAKGFDSGAISKVGLGKILKKYVDLYKNEPASSLKTKALFIGWTLGIPPHHIYLWEWDYDRWERGKDFGMSDSAMRHRFMDIYRVAVEKNYFPLRPYLVLLTAILFTILKLRITKNRIKDSIECQLILIAIFYYGGFIINNQSMEFRYFYPAFYLLAMTVISGIAAYADFARNRIQRISDGRKS